MRLQFVAIKLFRYVATEKRQIILMSEGLTEGLAYYHEDVITAARNKRRIIATIGYPRLPAQPIAVQALRRLSEETWGLYKQIDPDGYTVSKAGFHALFNSLCQ